ncbi:MAG: FtsW/RodA/SpoVE family cell cycle protein [Chloroflexota bacterium]|jgi:rod shape determining protein RodA|nr:rod shape-determining protein RodA [Anaerolineae bacterium]HMM29992.1 FtsW/RodA/SpoVE family cell cycle protein [Aggregatilineaceae bacterium]
MQSRVTIWRDFDFILLGTTALLVIIGILMIHSATMDAVDTELIARVPSQIRFGIIGIAVVFIVAAMDYRLLGSLHGFIYGFVLFILGLVAALGVVGEAGAQSWLNVGLQVQPAELGKILLVITLAQHLADRYLEMDRLRTVLVSLFHVAVPTLMVFLQPDLGTATVMVFVWFVMAWAAGLRLRHIALFAAIGLAMLPVLWVNMEKYQRDRIITFIDTGESCYDDPALMRSGECVFVDEDGNGIPDSKDRRFNVDQALISIGSGGFMGKGYANGSQTQGRFLRVRHTDFIFSVIAEEMGFVGATTVILLMGVVVWRCLKGAAQAADALGSLICYGVGGMIFFQTIVSIGMNLSILPVTGLTLPFVSSGGSSLLTMLIGIGLVESVVMRRRLGEYI